MANTDFYSALEKIKKIDFSYDWNFQKLLDDPTSIPDIKQFMETTAKKGNELRLFFNSIGKEIDIPKMKEDSNYFKYMSLASIYRTISIDVLVVAFIIYWIRGSFLGAVVFVVIFGVALYLLNKRFEMIASNRYYLDNRKKLLDNLSKLIENCSHENSSKK